jgi:hypothetical protein
MGAPFHKICSKNDRALMAYLTSAAIAAGTVADVYPAKRSGIKTLPCTICWTRRATEIGKGQNTGTFELEVAVMVRSLAPSDAGETPEAKREASDLRVGKTFDAFYKDVDTAQDKLAEDITTAARALAISDPANQSDLADYTCLGLEVDDIEAGFEETGSAWVDTLNLKMTAAVGNVS